MRARLLRGIAANGYGQAVTVAAQLATVPVLVHAWGGAGYGCWVLLTAVPTALAFADGGLVVASGNAMAMAVGRGATDEAAALHAATARSVARTVCAAAALALVALALVPFDRFMPSLPAGTDHPGVILATLAGVVLAGTVGTLPGAALRAGGRYAFAVAATTTTRLAETGAVLAAACFGGGMEAAAACWLLVRLAGTLWQHGEARRRLPWLVRSTAVARSPRLRALLSPALAALAMPAAFATALQGVTVAVGLALAPVAVAQFAATRTLARAVVQVAGLVTHAIMPELSRSAGDADAVDALVRLNTRVSLAVLVAGWSATMVFGPRVLAVWTHGRLVADPLLLDTLATAALLHGAWLSAANCLLAVNRQGEFAWLFLGLSLAAAVLAWPAALAGGLQGVAVLTLASEAAMAARVWLIVRRPRVSLRLAEGAVP